MEGKAVVEIIKDRLYWLSDSQHPKDIKNAFYFSIDNELVYEPFNLDFGPLNLGKTWRYMIELQKLIADPTYRNATLYHYTSLNPAKSANSAYLICAYQVVVMNRSPEQAFKPFRNIKFVDFRDASYGDCSYKCSILDCLRGLSYAVKLGWFNYKSFDLKQYQHYERVENGDLNWIVPGKFIAFSSPAEQPKDADGNRQFTPADYIPIFKKFGVRVVVRLNKKTYDAAPFTKSGIRHVELYFNDGTAPSLEIVDKFLQLAETTQGVIAVHCKAGLGRTGTLIGCFAMKHYQFNAADFIGWIRICRPGSILGPQQHFLLEQEKQLKEKGLNSPLWKQTSARLDQAQMNKQIKELSVKDKKSTMDERDREIQAFGDIGQGEKLVDAKARRQVRAGSLNVVQQFHNSRGSGRHSDIRIVVGVSSSYNQYHTPMNKFLRDISYVGVRNVVSRSMPGFDQYLSASRLPAVPRIVVYTPDDHEPRSIIGQYNTGMKWIIPTAEELSKPDEEVSKDIANQLLVPEVGVGHQGFIVDGFPFNVRQALMLDRFIKGVNLAIYIRTQDKTREDSLSELLDYYDQRGNLLTWSFTHEPTKHQAHKLWRQIVANIKIS